VKHRAFELGLLCALWLAGARAQAKELDQFTDRLHVLAYYAGGYRKIPRAPSPSQVDAVLDARMNQLLDELVEKLRSDPPHTLAERVDQVRAVFQHPLLAELITPYEEWAKHEAPLPLYKVRDKGIYGYAVDYDDMRMTWYIELSPIIQVGGVTIGIDKLGHFLAQGFQYYEHFRELDPALPLAERIARVREYGHEQELGQLGVATGGVYSPADLAANWSGMLFFMSLFYDVRVEGDEHARFIAADPQRGYRRVRDFHWAEWVSADWDEVKNASLVEKRALFDKVVRNFWRPSGAPGSHAASICDVYRRNPGAFIGPPAKRAQSHYMLLERAKQRVPYAIDVHAICEHPPAVRAPN